MTTSLQYLFNEIEPDNALIGKIVVKRSGKPFKSTFKIATVKGFTLNKFTQKLSFTFEEDDSVVECFRCDVLDKAEKAVEPHTHMDKYGVLHKCYHESKIVFKQWGFWIGITVSWPLEHALYQHVWPFTLMASLLGIGD